MATVFIVEMQKHPWDDKPAHWTFTHTKTLANHIEGIAQQFPNYLSEVRISVDDQAPEDVISC